MRLGGTKTGSKWRARTARLLGSVCLAALVSMGTASANPENGVVVEGDAEITARSADYTRIRQRSDRVVIDWESFDIASGETVQFFQPGSDSVALNRILSGDITTIYGRLLANGNVFLINPAGVLIGAGGRVDAHGFLATTADIANDAFMAGDFRFDRPSPIASAEIVNAGVVSVATAGLAALVGPTARNQGYIQARMGRAVLAGAETFTLDLYGDGLLSFDTGVDPSSPLSVENFGTISAHGGTVLLTTRAARSLVDSVINVEGIIEARTVSREDGAIVLEGGEGGSVRVGGLVDTGRNAGGAITASGGTFDLAVTGRLQAGSDLMLDFSGDIGIAGQVQGFDVNVVAGGDIALGSDSVLTVLDGGSLAFDAGGNLTMMDGASVSVPETARLSLAAGGDIGSEAAPFLIGAAPFVSFEAGGAVYLSYEGADPFVIGSPDTESWAGAGGRITADVIHVNGQVGAGGLLELIAPDLTVAAALSAPDGGYAFVSDTLTLNGTVSARDIIIRTLTEGRDIGLGETRADFLLSYEQLGQLTAGTLLVDAGMGRIITGPLDLTGYEFGTLSLVGAGIDLGGDIMAPDIGLAFGAPVELATSIVIDTSGVEGGDVFFAGPVRAAGGDDLTVLAGDIAFAAALGDTDGLLGNLTLSGADVTAGDIRVLNDVMIAATQGADLGSIVVPGSVTMSGGAVRSNDIGAGGAIAITVDGEADLGALSSDAGIGVSGGAVSAASLASSGNIDVTARDTAVFGAIATPGSVTITGGAVQSGAVNAGGIIEISGTDLETGALDGEAGISITAEGTAVLGALSSAGIVSLTGADMARLEGAVTARVLSLSGIGDEVRAFAPVQVETLMIGAFPGAVIFLEPVTARDAVTFANTGGVQLGDADTDIFTFAEGVTSVAGPTLVYGTVTTDGAPIRFGALSLGSDVWLESLGGAIMLEGPVDSSAEGGLAVDAGSADVSFLGAVGSAAPLGWLTVEGGNITLGNVATLGAQSYRTPGMISLAGTQTTQGADMIFDGLITVTGDVFADTSAGGSLGNGAILFGVEGGSIAVMGESAVALHAGGDITVPATLMQSADPAGPVEFIAGGSVRFVGGLFNDDLIVAAGRVNGDPLGRADQSITLTGALDVSGEADFYASGDITILAPVVASALTLQLDGTASTGGEPFITVDENFFIGNFTRGQGKSDLFGGIQGVTRGEAAALGRQLRLPPSEEFLFNECVIGVGCFQFDRTAIILRSFDIRVETYAKDPETGETRFSDLGNFEAYRRLGLYLPWAGPEEEEDDED